jgi:protein-S-isoprenylcysteine O-methyltransferase Ste14
LNRDARRRRTMIWLYLLVNVAVTLVWNVAFDKKSRGLVSERFHPGSPNREGTLGLLALGIPALGHYLVAILDISHFHWSDTVPFRAQLAGLFGYAASMVAYLWILGENPFFSSVVRIQRDRGQYVVSTGPYRFVRHPGYLLSCIIFLCNSLALGSWWSLLPAALWIPAVARRTAVEDSLLRAELEGYAAYAEKVRYRLLPGIW